MSNIIENMCTGYIEAESEYGYSYCIVSINKERGVNIERLKKIFYNGAKIGFSNINYQWGIKKEKEKNIIIEIKEMIGIVEYNNYYAICGSYKIYNNKEEVEEEYKEYKHALRKYKEIRFGEKMYEYNRKV